MIGLVVIFIFSLFWRFGWWPVSLIRARHERVVAENEVYMAKLKAARESAENEPGPEQ